MLVISGQSVCVVELGFPKFQSRNRDACHFRHRPPDLICELHRIVSISQSRCLSFQEVTSGASALHGPFQSRNRDACHFRSDQRSGRMRCASFNLAIEMLVISGDKKMRVVEVHDASFNLAIEMLVISGQAIIPRPTTSNVVSISQSRCLSFQVSMNYRIPISAPSFQSRNRDACHFRLRRYRVASIIGFCFNLAIEMLVISGI